MTNMTLARRAWTHFEPVHAIVYFASEARERYAAIGLRGGWMGYFASRSAPMGAVTAEVVTAVFHNFAPSMVHRAIPDAWEYAGRDKVLAARLDAVDGAMRRLWADQVDSTAVAECAELALEAASHLSIDGRPLYAGHVGLDVPGQPHLALWHACTLLREHRFDGHVAALTVHGLSGLEALVVQVAAGGGVDAASLRSFRGWTDEEWSAAEARLRERGLLDESGALSAGGIALRTTVENATDGLASDPWDRLPAARRERLLTLLANLAARLEGDGGLVYPNPIGVSRPVFGS
ncbi:MAG: hypothetical protein M3R48_00795 [Candidatus Dormibacteraeota bacterium]|nr:hypothetical protein [Candidatus Dormibacteraeota bacterium]